jgi:hypothetical protein
MKRIIEFRATSQPAERLPVPDRGPGKILNISDSTKFQGKADTPGIESISPDCWPFCAA